MKGKKVRALLLCAAITSTAVFTAALAGCGDKSSDKESGKAEDNGDVPTETFTFWLASGEKDQYYMDYADNPIVKYLTQKVWGEGDDAAMLDLKFDVASSTSPADSFTTLVYGGDYQDVMDLSYSQTSVTQLYDEGIAMDLTDLVKEYMPNYMELIQSDPAIYREAISIVDGEQKILQLLCLNDAGKDMYQGLMYRRDWLVRFGEMPEYVWANNADEILDMDHAERQDAAPDLTNYDEAREAYGDDAMETYTDNLVFPSGTKDPVFLSDWEWMFQTFEDKVWNNEDYTDENGETINSDNAYMMSVYYMGTSTRGDFSSAFGGGSPIIYYDNDSGKLVPGLTAENTRLYLEYMNEWYNKGWLDQDFTTRTSDVFYKIDIAVQLSGAIPAYIGQKASQLGNVLDNGSLTFTNGIMMLGAPIPINDVIGDADYRFVEPDTIYMEGKVASKCMITTAAEDKNLPALLSFIDYLYTEEGAELASLDSVRNSMKKHRMNSIRSMVLQTAHITKMRMRKTAGYTNGRRIILKTMI